MIYCYYDKAGILREIINDSDNRQGNNNTEILVYSERDDIDNISVVYAIGGIRFPVFDSITQFADGIERGLTVPYNKNINYKYFKDNTPYNFYKFIVPVDIMQFNGTCKATFSIHSANKTQPLGLLTFDIQDSVINKDDILTLSQWQYLLEEMAKVLQLRSTSVIGTNVRPTNGGVAPSNLDDGMFVLYYGTKTGEYTTTAGETIRGIELYEISGRTYQLRYESFTTSDRSLANQKEIIAHNQLYVQLRTLVEELAAQHLEFVKSDELSEVAFTGQYNDLKGKPSIPTKTSDLVNNSGYITNAVSDLINYYKKSETLTTDEILARISAIKTIKFEIYASLDDITNPQTNVIYLIGTESPYTEYAYIEGIGFEGIGSTAIDLSNYVQSDDTLNTDNIIVGNGDKNVKDSGFTINSQSKSGVLLNDDTKIPTGRLVMQEIQKYHTVYTINGDTGTIAGISYGTSPYFLIVDENLLVYRRISNENYHLVYHSQQVLDNNHIRDWYLKFGVGATTNDYVRTYVENVSHEEFDELVESTPTDVIYDTNTKVVQLTHDGMPIGEGAVVDINGFTPWFDGKTLVLSDVEELNADVATREWVNENTIVDLEEIPSIIDEKSPDLISVDGVVYYKKRKSFDDVNNLTNTTWIFNDSVNTTTGLGEYNINFTSDGINFVKISTTYRGYTPISYYKADGTEVKAYDNSNWTNNNFNKITITGGEDVSSTNLISFFKSCATLTEFISDNYLYQRLSWTKDDLKNMYIFKESLAQYNPVVALTMERFNEITKHTKIFLLTWDAVFDLTNYYQYIGTNGEYHYRYRSAEGYEYMVSITSDDGFNAVFEELEHSTAQLESSIGQLESSISNLQRRLDKPSATYTLIANDNGDYDLPAEYPINKMSDGTIFKIECRATSNERVYICGVVLYNGGNYVILGVNGTIGGLNMPVPVFTYGDKHVSRAFIFRGYQATSGDGNTLTSVEFKLNTSSVSTAPTLKIF